MGKSNINEHFLPIFLSKFINIMAKTIKYKESFSGNFSKTVRLIWLNLRIKFSLPFSPIGLFKSQTEQLHSAFNATLKSLLSRGAIYKKKCVNLKQRKVKSYLWNCNKKKYSSTVEIRWKCHYFMSNRGHDASLFSPKCITSVFYLLIQLANTYRSSEEGDQMKAVLSSTLFSFKIIIADTCHWVGVFTTWELSVTIYLQVSNAVKMSTLSII